MNELISKLVKKAQMSKHGFKDIEKESRIIVRINSSQEALRIAKKLYASDIHQARMLATFIFGLLAARSKEAASTLRRSVSRDENWRVQEILAKAFDQYCADAGYEKSLPVIKSWLKDKNPNVRRAVSEGLRIWTGRDYFKDHPEVAVRLLAGLKGDESENVRRSAGNALRDISRKHRELISDALKRWDISHKGIMQTYALACRFIKHHGLKEQR